MATFKGVITYASPVVGGISKSGKEWKRATYILVYDDSNGQYPKSISFDVVNDRIEKLDLRIGMEYEVSVDFTTREYNGRVYMSAPHGKLLLHSSHSKFRCSNLPPLAMRNHRHRRKLRKTIM